MLVKPTPRNVNLGNGRFAMFNKERDISGETNQLIHKLKKKKGDRGYHHKARAITECARALSETIGEPWLSNAALIPIPLSKIRLMLAMTIASRKCAEGLENRDNPTFGN